jgi:hypothetical protein
VTNACVAIPVEIPGVIGVPANGQQMQKSFYSNYGVGVVQVVAPGGDFPFQTEDPFAGLLWLLASRTDAGLRTSFRHRLVAFTSATVRGAPCPGRPTSAELEVIRIVAQPAGTPSSNSPPAS